MGRLLNRRQFIQLALKAASALGTYPAYPVLSYAATEKLSPKGPDVERHVSGCMWCQNGCSLIIHVKDGKAVHVTGNPDDPVTKGRMCIKPLGSLELLNSPYRLLHPLKRMGKRGDAAKFVKIGWEEALDEISEKLKLLRERHGGEALGIWASGRSAADSRWLNKAFATLYGTPNYEKTGPFCNYSGKPAGISVIGTRHTPWTYADDDFYGADLYIFIGNNMAVTRPVNLSILRKRHAQGGCRMVVVDPRRSETASKADKWLPITPGTDMALALAMTHYCITHDLVDDDFIAKHTVGYQQLKKTIISGQYDLSWGARITGLSKDEIRSLAKIYAKTKKAIMIGNTGVSHHTNAVQTHRAFYMLAAVTGHFGQKGMGYACLNNGAMSLGKLPVPKDRIPNTKMELGKNPAGWMESIDNPLYPYRLRALISTGSPLTQWPDQARLRRLMGKLDISVYNGLAKNINAYYFDYILPAATWIESGGLAPVSDDSRFVWVPRLVQAPGAAKPDRWSWIELGKRMGWGDIFDDALKDPVELHNLVAGPKGYTVERFVAQKDNALRAPIKIVNGKLRQRGTLFLDKRFMTKSGKIELWTEALEERFSRYGLRAIPKFYTDPEISKTGDSTISYNKNRLIASPFQKAKTYTYKVTLVTQKERTGFPYYLITGRPSEAIMGHISHWIKILNDVSPDQVCLIHPDAAKASGIRDGQRVYVRSPHGSTRARAVVTSGIRKDTLFIPYSYGEKSPFSPWRSVNYLTNLGARCPISGQVAFKGLRVAIKKPDEA